MKEIKQQFPIFNKFEKLTYLDNAATTQKPDVVIDAISNFYSFENSNVHRGFYSLAENATKKYENARAKIAKFINADEDEVIFVSSATIGFNGIVQSLINSEIIPENPKVLVTDLDHHSNILPWRNIAKASLKFLSLNDKFLPDYEAVKEDCDVVSISHVSNVTGTIIDPNKLNIPRKITILDASQSIGHMKIDVKKIGADILIFSGHKMYGPMGIGVVYCKKEILNQLEPFYFGGGMVNKVSKTETQWAENIEKFEAGTPNVAGAIGLGAAVKFLNNIGFDFIEAHEQDLRKYALEKLADIKDLIIFHPPQNEHALGVISVAHKSVHAHDLADYLGNEDICVRAGHHCAQILHRDVLHVPASLRVSFGVYNAPKDVDVFIQKLQDAIKLFTD